MATAILDDAPPGNSSGAGASTAFTLQTLVDSVGDFGAKPALLAFTKRERQQWSFRELLERYRATVVPVRICGTREAWPPGRRFPRFARVRVIIGEAISTDQLARCGRGETPHLRITAALRDRVALLKCEP